MAKEILSQKKSQLSVKPITQSEAKDLRWRPSWYSGRYFEILDKFYKIFLPDIYLGINSYNQLTSQTFEQYLW